VWSIISGSLPKGLTLYPNGYLSGTPSEAGSFTFDVKVESATQSTSKAFSLEVSAHDLPLTIVDQTLPAAEFGRSFSHALYAQGGQPPYTWSLKTESQLPEGLGLSPEGTIEGRAAQVREVPFGFFVEVKDAAGAVAAADLSLQVIEPTSLNIAVARLATAYVGESYRQVLTAIGGSGNYEWTVSGFQRLAENATEVPGAELPELPANFGIAPRKEGTGYALYGSPTQAGLYLLTLRVQDMGASGQSDSTTLPLLVTWKKGFSITTTALPDAFVNSPYNVRLSHNDKPEVGAKWTLACVQQAKQGAEGFEYECVDGDPNLKLPAGLILGEDGSLTGTPTTPPAAGSGSDTQVYSFLVKAVDASGRQDVRGLSVKLRPALPVDQGGCSGTGLGPAAMALLALAGLVRRRR
jgi:Putative Ig domain